MKTFISTIILSLFITTANAQGVYEQKMGEAFGTFAQAKTVADFKNTASKFEIIANASSDQWLPLYYHAQCHILMSFNDTKGTEAEKDAHLVPALASIEQMITMVPNESEVYALQALYYTAKLVINPMTRGQKYGTLTNVAIQHSLALDNENPRAQQLALSNKIGTARFFGKDVSVYCEEANSLLKKWDAYQSKGMFYPTWGKDQLMGIVANCAPAEDVTPETVQPTATPVKVDTNVLTITINNLNSDNGLVLLELMDQTEKVVTQTMGTVVNGTCTIKISNITAGDYAVRFYHDANDNKQMDTNKYGKPTEQYGYSNNARGFMGAPKYKKTLFNFKANKNIQIKAK